jgi:hypothetical protein
VRVHSEATNSFTELGDHSYLTSSTRRAGDVTARADAHQVREPAAVLCCRPLAVADRRFDFRGVLAVPFGSPHSGTDEALSEMVLRG